MCENITQPPKDKVVKLFNCSNVNYNDYKFTVEGVYSMTPFKVANVISRFIISYYRSIHGKAPVHILDATANIGGNSISFCQLFNNVTCIELKPTTAKILEHNCKLTKSNNVTIICDDFKNRITNRFLHNVDVIFIDPPWYINGQPNEGLSLDNNCWNSLPIDDILIRIKNIKKIIVGLKVPKGYTTLIPYNNILPLRKMDILFYYL